MYARHVSGFILPDQLDNAIQLWSDSVLPSVQQKKGFKSVRLLVSRKNAKIVSIGLWDTEADFQATIEWNNEQINQFVELFTTPPLVEGFEVVVDV